MNRVHFLAHFDRLSDAPDAIPRLRRFILDLAVRGKLVDQNPTDEPASRLMNSMRATKNQLSREGGGAERGPEYLTKADMPFEIPSNWIWVRLGDICSKTGSGSTPRGGKSVYQRSGVPFLRSQNVYDDGLRLNDVAYITHETHERMSGTAVRSGDLLLNITGGSIGRCCYVTGELGQANVSQHVAIIRVAVDGTQSYLHQLILSPYFQSFILSEQTGAGRGGLPKNRMDRIPVALPPVAEQHRIVGKVEELMALCDRLEAAQTERKNRRHELTTTSLHYLSNGGSDGHFDGHGRFCLSHFQHLTTGSEQIPTLRQTILKLAVRGRLISQDCNDEPAARFLGDRELVRDSAADPLELPSGWAWSSLGLIGESLGGGTPSKANPEYWTGSIPWVSPRT